MEHGNANLLFTNENPWVVIINTDKYRFIPLITIATVVIVFAYWKYN